jgi:hypothetical protein
MSKVYLYKNVSEIGYSIYDEIYRFYDKSNMIFRQA